VDLTPRAARGDTLEAGAEQLAPRPAGLAPRRRRHGRGAMVLLALVLVAGAVLLFEGLTNASVYYYNADEAVAKMATLGTHRFRIQGTVEAGTVHKTDSGVAFRIGFNGANVDVQHTGDPPDLFKEGIPVVLEGRFQGQLFTSDRIMVKHSEQYKAANPDRVPANAP